MGRLKYPSSANPLDEDACAVWLHRSAILGPAALGEAADAMVGLCLIGPITAFSGIYGSPRSAILGDVLGIVPSDPHGLRNGS
jgi:hypothetical protein